jgi:carboxylesterase
MQELPSMKKVRITVRYGDPIYFGDADLMSTTRGALRAKTHHVMKAISGLVDFSRSYETLTLPIPPYTPAARPMRIALSNPKEKRKNKAPVGVLVVHGFTSSISCVSPLEPVLKDLNVPYRFPLLSGHGTAYTDLTGVTWQDWYADAETAMFDLLTECEQVILIGHSMGGLVALDLAGRYDHYVAAVVPVAPALRFSDPLAFLSPVMARLVKSWPSPDPYNDPECRKTNDNYDHFMTSAFASLYEYSRIVRNRLSFVRAPLFVVHTLGDSIIPPSVSELVLETVSTHDKRVMMFQKSGHEMFKDLEREGVVKSIADYLKERVSTSRGIKRRKTDADMATGDHKSVES